MSFRIRLILPIIIILFAAYLRFYRFSEFVTFLGDQGRDAIIIKRIITLEHFPAIGAPSSLGQIFLGPFYYYLIAPFLLFFNFNPVGPAFGVGFLSIVGAIFAFKIVKKEFDFITALIFLIFISFSAVNVQLARFSWNPNLLPVFSFLALYFFDKTLTQKNKRYAALFGSFLSFSIQLHHLAFVLIIPTILSYSSSRIYFGISLKKILKQVQNDLKIILIAFISFVFFSLPLLIFDLRHNFLNTKNLLKFFSEGNPTDQEQFISRFLETNNFFYTHIFQTDFNQYFAFILTVVLIYITVKKFKLKNYFFIYINLVTFISYLLIFSVFNTARNFHYYNPVYFSFYLILSLLITSISKNKVFKYFIIIFVLALYIFFNLKSLSYLFSTRGNNQIKKAEIIADSILRDNPQIRFQTIALPYLETDGHIRYYLEIKGKRPLPADTLQEPLELFVLCFEKDCQVLGSPQWQIAAFKRAKVDKIWKVEGVKIYKLIHK